MNKDTSENDATDNGTALIFKAILASLIFLYIPSNMQCFVIWYV